MINKLRIVLFIVLFLLVLKFLPQFLLRLLSVNQSVTISDAIVLVAGNMKERLPEAARLFKEGKAPCIILANGGIVGEWSTQMNRNLLHIELAEARLVMFGVPREKIVKLPYYGSSTMFDALAVKRYLIKSGMKKIIVVTSDYHARRCLWTFRYVLKDYTGNISISSVKSFNIGFRNQWLECLKLGYYYIRYGLLGLVPQLTETVP